MGEHGIAFTLGPLAVSVTVVTTWGLMLLLGLSTTRIAVSYDRGPRMASLTSAVAPSSEICTST